jgi:hypothetical protein
MALFLISGALLFNRPEQTEVIHVSFPNGTVLEAEVADTPEKLLFGLAFQEYLPPNKGMLYIFDQFLLMLYGSMKVNWWCMLWRLRNRVLTTRAPGMVHHPGTPDM